MIYSAKYLTKIALRKICELGLPVNFAAAALQVIVEELFILTLLQQEYERIAAHAFAETREMQFAANFAVYEKPSLIGNRALLDRRLRQVHLLVNLERARVYTDGFGKRSYTLLLLDDQKIDAIPLQLTRERKPGWTSTDNQYVRRSFHHFMSKSLDTYVNLIA